MSRRIGIASSAGVSTGTSAKTLVQLIAAANHAIDISEVIIGFHGTTNAHEPIKVELVRQTDAGTMSSLTLVKGDDSVGDTLDTTAQHTATAEPTTTDVLRTWTVHPQTSMAYPFPEDTRPVVGAGDRVGLRVTAANDVNSDSTIVFAE
jgi:hypothetical protein